MKIDINTKFITLIGTPLSQSFSARMQNAAYASAHCNMVYFYTEVGSDHLREAKELGCKTVNGLDMLLYQGVRQIELWTDGRCAPLDAMRKELMTIMEEIVRTS